MSSFLRLSWWAATCLALMSLLSLLWAQDTNTPSDAAPAPGITSAPFTTNTPSTNFLEHPAGGPTDQPDLSLRPPSLPEAESVGMESIDSPNPADEVENLASHLLVVYNRDDLDSTELAAYYASCRNIPMERVLPISCSGKEEITRDEFEKTIRQPILFYLLQKNWMARKSAQTQIGSRVIHLLVATHNDIWAIVLMRGVPLKIAPDPSDDDVMDNDQIFRSHGLVLDPGTLALLKTNAAAVDSELAMLPIFGLPRGGFVLNGFFDNKMTGRHRIGSALAKNMILVSRLDGPTPAMVKRMIDDSLYAEQNRLAGLAVIDTRGVADPKDGFFAGDVWLRNAHDLLILNGWVVRFDDKLEVLPATDSLNQVALYLGWYSNQAEGPWITVPNRFVRGAIAYHLHSFNASTIRSEVENWVGPLIAHGAAASMGTVYEPLLGWTPHEDIFTKRLLDGNYFVEAAYASQMGLSWMTTVVGDPLYRPFRQPLESALAAATTPRTDHDDWLLLQQIRREIAARQIEMTADHIRDSLELSGVGPVAEEGLGDLLVTLHDSRSNFTADQAYQKAEDAYTLPIDRIRVGIKLSDYYLSHNQQTRAQAELDLMRQLFPQDAVRFGLVPPPVAKDPSPTTGSQPSAVPKRNIPQPVPATSAPPKPPKPPMPPFPQPMPQRE